jgi:hypothetical protein
VQVEDRVLLAVGALGILLGLLGVVARSDPFGTLMGLIVLGTGTFSLWLGWLYSRQGINRQQHRV